MGTKSSWTPERRARQADLIRQSRPWEKSTGPRTDAGKAISSLNAYAGDFVHEMRARRAEIMATALARYGRRQRPQVFD